MTETGITMTPNHGWTARWHPLNPHHGQLRLWSARDKVCVVTAGRRSGKTELAKRRLVEAAAMAAGRGEGRRFLAAATTDEQARAIYWADLIAMLDPDWVEGINETNSEIKTTAGAIIKVAGAERPERFEGVSWQGAICDEVPDWRPNSWTQHLLPTLDKPGAWAWVLGVPDAGARNAEEHARLVVKSKTMANWSHHTWSSEDILDEETAEFLRQAMDEATWRQEILGCAAAPAAAMFPEFEPGVHVAEVTWQRHPIYWSLDFNVDPMCSGVLEVVDGHVNVLHEIEARHASTADACGRFLQAVERYGWRAENLNVTGDSTGWARDTTSGSSDWAIVMEHLAHLHPQYRVPRANPGIRTTINAVRALLRNAKGEVRITIDPSCRRLIDDLTQAKWTTGTERHHALAWLRYAAAEMAERPNPLLRVVGIPSWSAY
jgi:hypothetical protein